MALTRAQLLMGTSSQGSVLTGQVQAVKQGAGTLIAGDGAIQVDWSGATGLVKLNNSTGYNGYSWPSAAGTAGDFLQTDSTGNLSWQPPQGVPVSSAAPLPAALGDLWYDTRLTPGMLRSYDGTTFVPVSSSPPSVTAPLQPQEGSFWYDTSVSPAVLNVWDGAAWSSVGTPAAGLGINITGSVVKVSISTSSSPPAVGGGASQAVVGSMYWDNVLGQLFIYYSNGGTPIWVQAAPAASTGPVEIPSGTKMLFAQTAAPTGWVKLTTYNDATLRVVSGAASSGGSVAFSTVFSSAVTVPLPQHTHAVSDPGHTHGRTDPGHDHGTGVGGYFSIADTGVQTNQQTIETTAPTPTSQAQLVANTDSSTTGISINSAVTNLTVTNSGTSGASLNLAVTYVDVIIATKS